MPPFPLPLSLLPPLPSAPPFPGVPPFPFPLSLFPEELSDCELPRASPAGAADDAAFPAAVAVAEGAEDCPAAAAGADAVEALGLAEEVAAAPAEPLVLVADAASGEDAVAGAFPTVVAVDPLAWLELGAEAFEVAAWPWLTGDEFGDTLWPWLPPTVWTAVVTDTELLVDRLPLFCAEAAFDEIDPCACEETALSGAPRDGSSVEVLATADISAGVNGLKRAIA